MNTFLLIISVKSYCCLAVLFYLVNLSFFTKRSLCFGKQMTDEVSKQLDT